MAYSGKYRVQNPSKYQGDYREVVYRSLWEKSCFKWCDSNSKVKKWSSEEVVIPYLYDVDKRYHRYFMDLKIVYESGKTVLVEVKPAHQTQKPEYPGRKTKKYLTESLTYIKNQNKWKAAKKYAKERDWSFEIWTEHRLEQMGLLPKKKKGFKPFPKKLKPYSKKK